MSKQVKKGVNGKEFVAAVDNCQSPAEIFELLCKTMDKETLKNRLCNVQDNDLIVALHSQVAKFNAGQGLRTSNQDCVEMAADKYHQLTKKGMKFFKTEMNKMITASETKRKKQQLMITPAMVHNTARC